MEKIIKKMSFPNSKHKKNNIAATNLQQIPVYLPENKNLEEK